MTIPFWKMHGAGNDFILVDDRERIFPITNASWIASICARRTGVGCDGVILVQKSEKADFRMRFINPDGGEVEMCGNGARCIARLAFEQGIASKFMSIDTLAGVVKAEIVQKNVCLYMTHPTDWQLEKSLDIEDGRINYSYLNSGVPHVVIDVDNLENLNIEQVAPKIRHHSSFFPDGTNVNFIHITDAHTMEVRTYERGVEGETLACGTGLVACGLIASKLKKVTPPLKIGCASGDILEFDGDITDEEVKNIKLMGPAEHVFRGHLEYT